VVGHYSGNSNPPGPIKLCSCQSTAGVIVWLCCAIYQSQQTMPKFWAKTMLLNQTGIQSQQTMQKFWAKTMLLNQTGIQSQQTMQKFWAKTMLLNQTGML